MKSLSVSAPAKLNLTLEILQKQRDGFHALKSIFLSIALFDQLSFSLRKDGEISLSSDYPEAGKLSLIEKAAKLLKKFTGVAWGAEIQVKKRIPLGAGLGGGSSDAAAVLKGLNRLWKLKLSEKDFLFLAPLIGSDVAFFVGGGLALAEGKGELVTPLKEQPQLHFVLVFPGLSIDTTWAYQLWDKRGTGKEKGKSRQFIQALQAKDRSGMLQAVYNDFEAVLFPQIPLLREIKEKLLTAGCEAAGLSGSGSSLFGVVDSREKAAKLARQLKKSLPGAVFALQAFYGAKP